MRCSLGVLAAVLALLLSCAGCGVVIGALSSNGASWMGCASSPPHPTAPGCMGACATCADHSWGMVTVLVLGVLLVRVCFTYWCWCWCIYSHIYVFCVCVCESCDRGSIRFPSCLCGVMECMDGSHQVTRTFTDCFFSFHVFFDIWMYLLFGRLQNLLLLGLCV